MLYLAELYESKRNESYKVGTMKSENFIFEY